MLNLLLIPSILCLMITTEYRKHVDSSILTYLPPDLRLGPWHEGCMVQGLWHMTGAKVLIENGEAKNGNRSSAKNTMRGWTPMRPAEVELELPCAANHCLVNCMMKHTGSIARGITFLPGREASEKLSAWRCQGSPLAMIVSHPGSIRCNLAGGVADCACVNYLYSVNSKF